jgi:hypothetical protein
MAAREGEPHERVDELDLQLFALERLFEGEGKATVMKELTKRGADAEKAQQYIEGPAVYRKAPNVLALKMLQQGKTDNEVAETLEHCGLEPDEIRSALKGAAGTHATRVAMAAMARRTWRDDLSDFFTLRNTTLRNNTSNDGLKEMALGGIAFVIGAAVTAASYMGAVAEGGDAKFWVLGGAVVWGFFYFLLGFAHYLTYRAR